MSDTTDQVERLVSLTRVEPGDYVAIHVPAGITAEEADRTRQVVNRVWPGINVLFLVEPARMSVLRPVEAEGADIDPLGGDEGVF